MKNESHTLVDPPVEELLTQTGGCNFRLVALAAARARQINDYHNQLGQGIGSMIPPQVHPTSHKALTMAFEEIAAGKIVPGAKPSLPENASVLQALGGQDTEHLQSEDENAQDSATDTAESP